MTELVDVVLGGTFHAVDVTDEDNVEQALADAVSELGGLHIAVNTAGGGSVGRTLSKEGPHPLAEFGVQTVCVFTPALAVVFACSLVEHADECGPFAAEERDERISSTRPGAGSRPIRVCAGFDDAELGQLSEHVSHDGVYGLLGRFHRQVSGVPDEKAVGERG